MEQTANLRQAISEYKNGNAEAFTLLYQESSKYIYTCIYKVMKGNVLVSEGNSSTWCSYSLDADGNLTIYASSETLEGKYNAEQDCVKLYGTNYYRH